MIDILEEYLAMPSGDGCAMNVWITSQGTEVQELFEKLCGNKSLNLSALYTDLNSRSPLPFKISLFRMHMRGTCSCKK